MRNSPLNASTCDVRAGLSHDRLGSANGRGTPGTPSVHSSAVRSQRARSGAGSKLLWRTTCQHPLNALLRPHADVLRQGMEGRRHLESEMTHGFQAVVRFGASRSRNRVSATGPIPPLRFLNQLTLDHFSRRPVVPNRWGPASEISSPRMRRRAMSAMPRLRSFPA